MVYYYLDLETHGEGDPNPEQDKIISIFHCAMDPSTGKQIGEPVLLKSWDSSEEDIVKKLYERLKKHVFDFVPVGFSVLFDLWFLKSKFNKYCEANLDDSFFVNRPYLDLKHVAVLANQGRFKGVRLTNEGNPIKDWYEFNDYSSIERHMQEKFEKFLEAYEKWHAKLQ
ncbi:MAG: hypothetical protein OXR66_03640 [Candidatus Woesearchaeota archaeon]|nr:hypothetical protein [Candidatus Woesearchaeota archaeon]